MFDVGSETDLAHDDHGFEAVPCTAFSSHGLRDINGEEEGGFGCSGPVSTGPEGVVSATVGGKLKGCWHVYSIPVREICDVFQTAVKSHVLEKHVADSVNQCGVPSDDFQIGALAFWGIAWRGSALAGSPSDWGFA